MRSTPVSADPIETPATSGPKTGNPAGRWAWSHDVLALHPHPAASGSYRPEARYPDISRARRCWNDLHRRCRRWFGYENRSGPRTGRNLGLGRWSRGSLVNRQILHPMHHAPTCQGEEVAHQEHSQSSIHMLLTVDSASLDEGVLRKSARKCENVASLSEIFWRVPSPTACPAGRSAGFCQADAELLPVAFGGDSGALAKSHAGLTPTRRRFRAALSEPWPFMAASRAGEGFRPKITITGKAVRRRPRF